MTSQNDTLIYNRQFIIGNKVLEKLEHWNSLRLNQEFILMTHPNLSVSHSTEQYKKKVVILGDVFDPNNVEHTNQDIVNNLIANVSSFSEFESYTNRFSGHWLCFIMLASESRIYPDACGMRPLHYTTLKNNQEFWLGTQPGLFLDFLGIEKDTELLTAFQQHGWPGWWPGEITPYKSTYKLPSNHYMDLDNRSVHRFWPTGQLQSHSNLEEAADKMSDLLTRIMRAITLRGPVIFSLTGGYDCRMIFACTDKSGSTLEAFSMAEPNSAKYDLTIPRSLTKKFNMNFQLLQCQDSDLELLDIFRKNTGYTVWDAGSIMLSPLNKLPDDATIVTGLVGEVFRSFYKPKLGKVGNTEELTAINCAEMCEYSNNPYAVEAFSKWFLSLPTNCGIDILDLLYWEQRAGNWAACAQNGLNTFVNSVPPLNCRELLEIGVSVPEKFKDSPYFLARKICEISEPGVLTFPFNYGFRDSVTDTVSKIVPWRIRHEVEKMRYSKAGLRETYSILEEGCNLNNI